MLTHQNKCLEISHVQLAKFYLETERVIMFCFVYTRPPAWEARFANMLGLDHHLIHHKKVSNKKRINSQFFINKLSCEMVFLLTLPSVITICKVSIDGMRIQGRIVEKSKKVGSTFKKKGQMIWLCSLETRILFRVELPQPNKLF